MLDFNVKFLHCQNPPLDSAKGRLFQVSRAAHEVLHIHVIMTFISKKRYLRRVRMMGYISLSVIDLNLDD
eukprot:snap_masked-scaffold_56-processed-gene-0.32-mRNA-1 protein AED:1.00 eAED:1.00 QI:0/0/0/0/1/1/2/0/69